MQETSLLSIPFTAKASNQSLENVNTAIHWKVYKNFKNVAMYEGASPGYGN